MSTDLFKTVLFNDGEGISFGDANDSQRFLAARLSDQILEKLIGNPASSDPEFGGGLANASTAHAYCLDIGGAYPKQGSANNKIKLAAGTLFQKIGNATGNEPQLLAFAFDGTTEFTLANGDATNPRVDMLQMKLEYITADLQSRDFEDGTTHALSTQSMYKKRQVQCTLSIKQGTPAASPAYPSPDSGYVPIACVVVGETYSGAAGFKYVDTASSGVAVLHDLRMPVNIRPSRTFLDQDNQGTNPYYEYNVPAVIATDNVSTTQGITHTRALDKWTIAASANPIYYPLDFLQVGDVIWQWAANVYKNTANTNTITGKIIYTDDTGVHDAETAITDNSNAPGQITFASFAVNAITVSTGRSYYWKFIPGGGNTPAADQVRGLKVWVKRLGFEGALICKCLAPRGRLIAASIDMDSGSTSANKMRICDDVISQQNYLADISSVAETGATAKRHVATFSTINSHPIFTAGPTISGNGTHYPPIWGNGKRCYDESATLGVISADVTTTDRLAVRVEYPANVYNVTFYMAEGI